jgi:hypothetical protein
MPPDEVAEAEGLHDGAEEKDYFFVGKGVVEGHDYSHTCPTSSVGKIVICKKLPSPTALTADRRTVLFP